jgi:sterol desaturase/sphingolipid hydroxylase (fatty acid hydroxylase superfamily)
MVTLLAIIAAFYATFAILDFVAPARKLTRVRLWRLRGIVAFFLYVAISIAGPMFWDAAIAEHMLFDASGLPLWAQIGGGFLLLELGVYIWHRTMHAVEPLWRHLHQMHHSAERIDIWSAFWFHPLDMVGWTLLSSLVLVGGFGISLEAAIPISLFSTFLAMFQHSNISTPQWLGYFIARPENHAAHHERGVHGYNYGNISWFDLLFGTFRNPEKAPDETGFFDGASNRIGALLIGRKIA